MWRMMGMNNQMGLNNRMGMNNQSGLKNVVNGLMQMDIFKNMDPRVKQFLKFFLLGIGILIVVIIIAITVIVVMKIMKNRGILEKCIIKGTKNGKNSLVIRQSGAGPKSLLKTMDMNKGLEFTYTLWMNINSLEYNKDREMKPIFYKSKNKSLSSDDFAPGLFLLKNNTLRVMMKTGNEMDSIDIGNIPIKKWFHICLMIKQDSMDIYINGQMVQSKRFKRPPSQNDGDLYINTYGGFDGTISDLKFFAYSISYDKINKLLKDGPTTNSSCNVSDTPPYFNYKWWILR